MLYDAARRADFGDQSLCLRLAELRLLADLTPVSLICRYPNILAVAMSSPVTTVRGFIDHAKANPGKVTHSSPGIGTTPHLSGELFKRMAGIELTHVPYRGAAAGAVTDAIAAGRFHIQHRRVFAPDRTHGPAARPRRHHGAALPDRTRTADHRGVRVPAFDVVVVLAVGLAKTRPTSSLWLNAATVTALSSPLCSPRRWSPGWRRGAELTPEQLGAPLRSEIERWGPIKAAHHRR
jgi:tripartite-type tricarboxylate transporter receptor subunit TctC